MNKNEKTAISKLIIAVHTYFEIYANENKEWGWIKRIEYAKKELSIAIKNAEKLL